MSIVDALRQRGDELSLKAAEKIDRMCKQISELRAEVEIESLTDPRVETFEERIKGRRR